MSTAVFTFGRMNPPTIGHEKLVNKLRKVARLIRGQPFIYLSHSQDAKKNPLDYNSKIKISQSAFGAIAKRSTSNTIMKVMAELEAAKFTDVVLVAGSDRVKSFDQLLQQYNGKDYNFNSIKVVSAGQRDPDAEGAGGMSASKMRDLAKDENLEDFTKGLPLKVQKNGKDIMKNIRKGMKL
jgi:nicotinic acid mononucleotide adenylyltransferase